MKPRKKGSWSAQELERLQELYPRRRREEVARLLGRSVQSVQRRAERLFCRRVVGGAWTEEEDRRLCAAYGVLGVEALCLVLARTASDVRARIAHLRRRRRRGGWTRNEDAMLKQLYGSRSNRDLEVCLSRPIREIEQRAAQLCLSKDKRYLAHAAPRQRAVTRMPRWTPGDVERLRVLYGDHDNLELARVLRRSVASIANKASQLGLRKSRGALRQMGRRNVAVRYRRARA